MFHEFMTDTVDLLKSNGAQHLHNKASVQKNKVIMAAGNIVIESGDTIRRLMSNGAVELYEVVDPGFHEAFEDFPKHYQMAVKRLPAKVAGAISQQHTEPSAADTTRQAVLNELAQYEARLADIQNRFTRAGEGIWIGEGDAELLLQSVRELIDLLDSTLGRPNDYSRQISEYYGHGLSNMHRSPSLQSVRDITSMVKAAQTYVKRPTTVLKPISSAAISGTKVFIGHGHSKEWLALKDFIAERMHLTWDEFNRVSAAGIATADRLKTILNEAAIAFLVLTAEDERGDGKWQARMNVIHEAGLFQGQLGFNRAIIMLEEGCEEFSNIHGLGQIRFQKNNIRGAFHEVELVLEREGLIESPNRNAKN